MCEVTSWIPHTVVETLRDRSAQPVVAWLTLLRASIEEYDPLMVVRPPSALSEDTESEAEGAFDEILSQLGKEIYKLDEYRRNLAPAGREIPGSILDIFDECLDGMSPARLENETKVIGAPKLGEIEMTEKSVSECDVVPLGASTPAPRPTRAAPPVPSPARTGTPPGPSPTRSGTPPGPPAREPRTPPVPPRRSRPRSPAPSAPDDIELGDLSDDSASTGWSYQECATEAEAPRDTYALVWSHSSGYHNSDDILRRVLAAQRASPSRLSFDTASDSAEAAEVERPVAAMTPLADDGYEPVRDAITDENIYEEIEYSYTDEGCSCGSVEVESLSVSASSGRESPLYANLRDHDAYAIPPDVIYWKKYILGDPFYNEDEEDEWITPEECEVYSRERRPPLVIPRITQYRAPRRSPRQTPQIPYPEQEVCDVPAKSWQYSPTPDRSRIDLERSFAKANYDSPSMWSAKRLSGSTENLLGNIRRPTHLQLPASSSGDSLDVEIRERKPYHQERSRSMMAPKPKSRAPQPSPRLMDVRSEKKSRSEDPIIDRRYIKRTKYMEGGKKCKKNWVESYMTLTHTSIRFYKNEGTFYATMRDPPSPSTPRPELVIMLHSAYVELSQHSHTRRHSRSLVLSQGNDQYLLQDESEESARNLLRRIQNVIGRLGPSYMMMDDRPSPVCSSGTDAESVGRTPPVSRHVAKVKQKAGGSSIEDLSDSTEIVTKSDVRSKLKRFFAKRPSMDVLVKSGIYKDEPVFGRKLEEVCPTTSPRVPEFVKACIREIESSEENMATDGLYRASGNLSQVQKIRLEVDQNNFSVIENNTDIHVLTGSLKLFFRELKEPLIPFTLFDRVLAACSIKPREARVKEFRDIIQSLPQCNRETLKYLLEHLLKVTLYSERNRMHTANLAIVFGPTLLWAEKAENIAIDCIQQNHVVDILLNDFKEIFVEDTKVKKKA